MSHGFFMHNIIFSSRFSFSFIEVSCPQFPECPIVTVKYNTLKSSILSFYFASLFFTKFHLIQASRATPGRGITLLNEFSVALLHECLSFY